MVVAIPLLQKKDSLQIVGDKKIRNSNLELYRIICMLMIVAHHYVVNSGLADIGGPLKKFPFAGQSIYLWLFGMWGKVGINCFMLITGYFMCESKITIRKFLKLLLQIYFFNILIYIVFLLTGRETVSLVRFVKILMPFWKVGNNFIGCYILFFLTIPFWTILVHNITKRQHECLLLLLIGIYSILGSIPSYELSFNYISWFGVLFLVASYIRLYNISLFQKRRYWGVATVVSIIIAMISVPLSQFVFKNAGAGYMWVIDSNKILALAVSVCSFIWFKNMNIRQSGFINAIGGSVFGVLLIHANSDAMRTWLWKDTVDVVGHYSLPLGQLVLFSIGVVFAVFIICNIIDQLRIATLEKWFFNWYDRKLSVKADDLVKRLTT